MPTFYEVLGVREGAGPADIRQAFLQGCLKYHPDKNRQKGGDEAFNLFVTAYKTLQTPNLRAIYDASLRKQSSSSSETPLEIEGNDYFKNMEIARRYSVPGAMKVSLSNDYLCTFYHAHTMFNNYKIQNIKSDLEKSVNSGVLRFNEGVPCNGESCNTSPHKILRVSDNKFLPKPDSRLFVCLKHKYLHFCDGESCIQDTFVCRVYAWYLASRWHRYNNKRELVPPKVKKQQTCKKSTCRKHNNKNGFVKLTDNVWTCTIHPRPHFCDGKTNNLCEFAELSKDGVYICWATNQHFFTANFHRENIKDIPDAPGVDLEGRLRLLPDGSSVFVPWGLNIGEPIPELESSAIAQVGKLNQKRLDDQKDRKLKEIKDDENIDDAEDKDIYQQYIGVLRDATLNQDEIGDYITLHHGRMGGDEGGTGFEGFEDEQEELQQEAEDHKDVLVNLVQTAQFREQLEGSKKSTIE